MMRAYCKWVLAAMMPFTFAPLALAQGGDAPSKAEGLVYYLPKHVLQLETSTKTETRREARPQLSEAAPCDSAAPAYPLTEPINPPKPATPVPGKTPVPAPTTPVTPPVPEQRGKLCIEETAVITRVIDVHLKLVPDLTSGQKLTVPGKALADVKLSVEFREGSLLKSLNASSQGRAGDVIVGIAKIAAIALSGGLVPMLGLQGAGPPAPTNCNPFFSPFKDQADNLRLLLSRNATACDAWVAADTWNKHAQRLAIDVKASEERLGGSSGTELTDVVTRLKDQRKAVDDARKTATALQSAVTAMLENFVQTRALGPKIAEVRASDALELHDLPGNSVDISGTTEWRDLQTTLANAKLTAAADVLKRSGVAIRLLPLQNGAKPGGSLGRSTCAEAGNDRLDVWFRAAQPVRLQVFVAETPIENGRPRMDPVSNTPTQVMKLVTDRVEPVTFQGLPPRCITFKASSFANRELVVSFDERGQLAKVDHGASSSAAAAVTALASAATTFRDEYATTLAKVVEMDSNERKLKLSDLTTRVETLKKERERLDAQLAAESGAANYDLALQQQRLTAEAAQLQAETALETARSTAEQKLALEQIKLELDLVKRELELVKAKQELAAAKQ